MISARDLLGKWPEKAKQFNATRSFTETLYKHVNSTRIYSSRALIGGEVEGPHWGTLCIHSNLFSELAEVRLDTSYVLRPVLHQSSD